MCLCIDKSKNPNLKPLIANNDITVWKIINSNNISAIRDFKYIKNKKYKFVKLNALRHIHYDNAIIEAGYHAYRTRDMARYMKSDYSCEDHMKIVKFIIPKGAKYYFGTDGDIVSNTIVSGDLKSQ